MGRNIGGEWGRFCLDKAYVLLYDINMKTLNITGLRKDIYNIIDEINKNNEPILINGKRSNAVLISENDWNSLTETIYLTSNKNLAKSIKEGLNTPISKCNDKIDW